jgi:hypothetical protein
MGKKKLIVGETKICKSVKPENSFRFPGSLGGAETIRGNDEHPDGKIDGIRNCVLRTS